MISPAVCIDVHDRVSHNANYLLTMADLKDWEYTFGSIEDGSVVLLNTGWSAYWDDPSRYIYVSRDGDMTFPGFSEEATKFLISDRSIRGVGIDSPGVDGGSNLDYSINKLVLSEKRIVLENLTNKSCIRDGVLLEEVQLSTVALPTMIKWLLHQLWHILHLAHWCRRRRRMPLRYFRRVLLGLLLDQESCALRRLAPPRLELAR